MHKEYQADEMFKKGNAEAEKGNHHQAIDYYTKSIELHPDFPNAYFNRATVKRKLEDMTGALTDYTKAIELRPEFPLAFHGRGITYGNLGMADEALEDYSKAIKLNKRSPNSYPEYDCGESYYNRALLQDSLEKSFSDLDKAIECNPNLAAAYAERGNLKFLQKEHQEALEDYNKALEIDPSNLAALVGRNQVEGSPMAKKDLEYANQLLAKQNKQQDNNLKHAEAYGFGFNAHALGAFSNFFNNVPAMLTARSEQSSNAASNISPSTSLTGFIALGLIAKPIINFAWNYLVKLGDAKQIQKETVPNEPNSYGYARPKHL